MSRDRLQEDLSAMAFTGMLLVAVLLLAAAAAPAGASESFLASVVSFAPDGDPRDGAPENLQKNLVDIQSLLSTAQLGTCDLVVLPELVFYYAGIERALAEGKAALREYAVPLPPVGSNPCAFKPGQQNAAFLRSLSCTARDLGSYVVANVLDLVETGGGGYKLFNTDVAFDRTGSLVAKYWKWHTFGLSPLIDQPGECERRPASFETDFGVPFGLFVCFDIEFEDPVQVLLDEGVRHFAFSSAWVNNPPFGFATEIQQGWSKATGAALLASNIGSGVSRAGSGIYVAGRELATDFNSTAGPINRVSSALVPKTVDAGEAKRGPVRVPPSLAPPNAGAVGNCSLEFLPGVSLNATCVVLGDKNNGPQSFSLSADDLECQFSIGGSTFEAGGTGVPVAVAFSTPVQFPSTVDAVDYKGCMILPCVGYPLCSSPNWSSAVGKLGPTEIRMTADGTQDRFIPLFSIVELPSKRVVSRELDDYEAAGTKEGGGTVARIAKSSTDSKLERTASLGIINVKVLQGPARLRVQRSVV